MLIQGVAGAYRLGTWQLAELGEAGPLTLTVDPYAGIRYTYLEGELRGRLDVARRIDRRRSIDVNRQETVSDDKHWVDPIVGLRTQWTLGERWALTAAGDVGGFKAGSDLSAQAIGAVGCRFGLFAPNDASVIAGYKVLYQDYTDGGGRDKLEWNVTMHGPVVGLALRC